MPYPNFHSCRLHDPDKYDKWANVDREHNGKKYQVIRGKIKNSDEWEDQAYRYPKETWTEAEARAHCKEHKGIKFEPAKKEEEGESNATIARIIGRLNSSPWAIRPEKLEAIEGIIDRKLKGETVDFELVTSREKDEHSYMTVDDRGIATIRIHGTMGRRLNMIEKASGGVSTEILLADFVSALADKKIKAILLHVDSPGGMVDGIKELADSIYHARDLKPVFAIAEGEMASAAYWVGSAAQKVFAEPTSLVGSIGVVATHYDFSGYDEKTGIKRTYIYNGKFKRIASDVEPLSDEGRAYLQGIVDDYYSIFVEDVAQNRESLSSEDILSMESKIYIADKARKQKLIDGIGSYSDVYKQLKAEARIMDMQELRTEYPDLHKETMAEGLKTASREDIETTHPEIISTIKNEAVKAEQKRVMDIFTNAYGTETAEKFGKIIKPEATVQDMMAFAQDKAKADILAEMTKEAPESVGQEIEAEEEKPSAENKTFEQLVSEYMEEHGCKKGKAVSEVARIYPEKHDEYVSGLSNNKKAKK